MESGWKAILGHLASNGNECVLNNEPRIQWLFISHNGNMNFGVYLLLWFVLPFVEFDLNFVAKTWVLPLCQKRRRREQASPRGFLFVFIGSSTCWSTISTRIFLEKFADVFKTSKSPPQTNVFPLQKVSPSFCFFLSSD